MRVYRNIIFIDVFIQTL